MKKTTTSLPCEAPFSVVVASTASRRAAELHSGGVEVRFLRSQGPHRPPCLLLLTWLGRKQENGREALVCVRNGERGCGLEVENGGVVTTVRRSSLDEDEGEARGRGCSRVLLWVDLDEGVTARSPVLSPRVVVAATRSMVPMSSSSFAWGSIAGKTMADLDGDISYVRAPLWSLAMLDAVATIGVLSTEATASCSDGW